MKLFTFILVICINLSASIVTFSSCHVKCSDEEGYDDIKDSRFIKNKNIEIFFASGKDWTSLPLQSRQQFKSYTYDELKKELPSIIMASSTYPCYIEFSEVTTNEQLRLIYTFFEERIKDYPFLTLKPFKYKNVLPQFIVKVKQQGDIWYNALIQRQEMPKRAYIQQHEKQLARELEENKFEAQAVEDFEESNGPNSGMASLGYFKPNQ